jgi:hypothetical protein
MGILRTTIEIWPLDQDGRRIVVHDVMLGAAGRWSPTIFAFGAPGDMTLLGAFGLEGLNLRVDLGRRELVLAGPVPAAAAA